LLSPIHCSLAVYFSYDWRQVPVIFELFQLPSWLQLAIQENGIFNYLPIVLKKTLEHGKAVRELLQTYILQERKITI
jgi:hypothetical protein